MDDEEISNIARRFAKERNLADCKVETTAHTVGTNVWTVVMPKANTGSILEKLILWIDDDTGNVLHWSMPKQFSVEVTENVKITDHAGVQHAPLFRLREPVFCELGCIDSERIQVRHGKTKNEITGFFIQGDKMIEIVKKAHEVVGYLALKTGRFVYFETPLELVNGEFKRVKAEQGKIALPGAMDFTGTDFANAISDNSEYCFLIPHYASGMQALEAYNYAQAIREFNLVFEFSGLLREYGEYNDFRNAASHASSNYKDNKSMQRLVTKYPFLKTKNNILDMTDQQTLECLKKVARNMSKDAKKILYRELNLADS